MINIIIPTIPGNEEVLCRCLAHIIQYTKMEYKLIIVKNDCRGFAISVNIALRTIDDDCVIMNDDAIPTENWLEELVEASKNSDIICQHGQLRPEHSPFFCIYIKKEVVEPFDVKKLRLITIDFVS